MSRAPYTLIFTDPTRSEAALEPVRGMKPIVFRRGERDFESTYACAKHVMVERDYARELGESGCWRVIEGHATKAHARAGGDAFLVEVLPEPPAAESEAPAAPAEEVDITPPAPAPVAEESHTRRGRRGSTSETEG